MCRNLGYNHYPFTWLEDTCDIMIDDNINIITNIMKFDEKVRELVNSGESISDIMCNYIFKCKASRVAFNPDLWAINL